MTDVETIIGSNVRPSLLLCVVTKMNFSLYHRNTWSQMKKELVCLP